MLHLNRTLDLLFEPLDFTNLFAQVIVAVTFVLNAWAEEEQSGPAPGFGFRPPTTPAPGPAEPGTKLTILTEPAGLRASRFQAERPYDTATAGSRRQNLHVDVFPH